jgi:hypothetical protein
MRPLAQIESYLKTLIEESEKITNKYSDPQEVPTTEREILISLTSAIVTIAFVLEIDDVVEDLQKSLQG